MKLKIDGQEMDTEKYADSDLPCGPKSILDAARLLGIRIPTLCHHPSLEPYGACRLCTVQLNVNANGRRRFVTACNYPIEEGLVVETRSEDVLGIRRMMIELLLSRCPNEAGLERLALEYGVANPRFVQESEDCILCGLCHRVCGEIVKVSAIDARNRGVLRSVDTPYSALSEECIGCGACALLCPTGSIRGRKNIYPLTQDDIRELEGIFLAGPISEEIGVHRAIFSGRSAVEGQDGGMATSILLYGLESGLLDAAIVAQKDERLGARACVATDRAAVMLARGTKYVRVSVAASLQEALESGLRKIAVVGTPCQTRAVRKLQWQGYFDERYPDREIYLIGLFCFESFDYLALKEHISRLFGIQLDGAARIQISGGRFRVMSDGVERSCRVQELGGYVREGCEMCDDLTNRLADISIGSIGSQRGFSTVIVRSRRGERLLYGVQFERGIARIDEVSRLAAMKAQIRSMRFSGLVEGQSNPIEDGGGDGREDGREKKASTTVVCGGFGVIS